MSISIDTTGLVFYSLRMRSFEDFSWQERANFHFGRLFPGCGMEGDRRKIYAATFLGGAAIGGSIEMYQILYGEGFPIPFADGAVIETDRSSVPFRPVIKADGTEQGVTGFAVDTVQENKVSPHIVARSVTNFINTRNSRSE